MEKINDIKKNLDKNIDIEKIYKKQEIKVTLESNNENLISDINIYKKRKIDLRKRKDIKIIENNRKIFDSLVKNKKLKDINIQNPTKITKILKSRFNKYFSKNFIKKVFYKIKTLKISHKKLYFIIAIFLLLLFFNKIIIENLVNSWYKSLLSIKNRDINIEDIERKINNAKLNFIVADVLFKTFLFIPSKEIKSWYHAISWWKDITKLWDELLQIYSEIEDLVNKKWIENIITTNLILNLKKDFLNLNSYLENVLYHYKQINDTKDKKLNEKLKAQVNNLEYINEKFGIIKLNIENLIKILWHYKEKKYLIIFQNNDEIRPMWWFMGSMALMSINSWKIKSFEPKDIYAYEWNLKKSNHERIMPPKAIEKLTNTFWLRDANYFANIKDSSQSIKYFVEKAWYNIDWIIYINQNTTLDFLELVWEFHSKSIWKIINKDNFSRIISTLVEAKVSKKWTLWTPKEILFNFIKEFKEKLEEEKDYISYLKIILDNIKKREIIFYSFEPKLNEFLNELWLNWNLDYNSTLDFSYPVFTSISWNKSDRYIKRRYEKNIKINSDCSIDTDFKISLSHLFTKSEENRIKDILKSYNIVDKSKLIEIQWAWDNYSFVKLLLPKYAQIEKKQPIEITKLKDKTLVEFFIKTKRFETSNFYVKYKLENSQCKKYDFRIYKQPWIKSYEIKIVQNGRLVRNSWIKEDYYYSLEE